MFLMPFVMKRLAIDGSDRQAAGYEAADLQSED
jgi:hypothetical protein